MAALRWCAEAPERARPICTCTHCRKCTSREPALRLAPLCGPALTPAPLARTRGAGTAGSGGERGQSAHSILELALTTEQPHGAAGSSSGEQKIHLRLGKEGMVDLLGKLDKIQAQIDKLS